MLDSRAQGGAVFRLLIGAIMGLMILMIILSVVQYFNDIRLSLGMQNLLSSFETAVHKADGTVIKAKDIELPPNSVISSFSLAKSANISPECVKIEGSENGGVKYNSDISASIPNTMKLTVYIKCIIETDCNPSCLLSINRKIE